MNKSSGLSDNGKCEVVDDKDSPPVQEEVMICSTKEEPRVEDSVLPETNLSKSNPDYSEESRISKLDAFQVISMLHFNIYILKEAY